MTPPRFRQLIARLALGVSVCTLAACGGSNPAVTPAPVSPGTEAPAPDTSVKPVIRCAP